MSNNRGAAPDRTEGRNAMEQAVKELEDKLNVSTSVAKELAMLAGGDTELAVKCSEQSIGLNECKARIINKRFLQLEDELFE
jgi:hypothetical protein